MEKKKTRSPVPFYAVGALWLVYGLLFPLYEPMHYALLTAVSAAVFFGLELLCGSGRVIGGAQTEKKAPEKPKEEPSTGNAELDKVRKDIRLAVSEMKRLDESIEDPGISADIVRLEQISEGILAAVKQDPKKLPQIRRFMDYYLPTTLKLLNSYDRMSGAGVSGENISSALTKVEAIMRTIVAAFEKQLDSLYGADALDISTDITVLETMLAREGLGGLQMNADKTPEQDSGEIKLEL